MADKGRRKANISEVAKAAGVSKMTVSRMYNDAAKVAPATRVRVQKVIDELRYQPSAVARGLASRSTRIIGIMIFDNFNSNFFQPMFLAVEQEARAHGYDLLIFSRSREGPESRCLGLVDGVLCFGFDFDNDTIENLENRGVPFAIIGKREWRKVSPWYVTVDYFEGFRKATEYLLAMGHRKIAFFGGSADFCVDAEKYAGYRRALADRGITEKNSLILCGKGVSRGSAGGEVGRLRKTLERFGPTAVILEGDNFPLPFLLTLKEMELKIPRDISVIYTRRDVIDIHTLYDLTGIHELTLAEIPRKELGIAGVRLLKQLIDGEKNIPKEQMLPLKIIPGESCAPPKRRRSSQEERTNQTKRSREVLCKEKPDQPC
jgi:DNA-binding LacI/PurR family transcriptional regulator